jgi:hypothetical protein
MNNEATFPIRKYRPSAVLTKTKTDRSLRFIMLMRPVIKAAPDMLARMIVKATARTKLDPGPNCSKPIRTSAKTKNNILAIAKPTDHLPKEVFGRILMCTKKS